MERPGSIVVEAAHDLEVATRGEEHGAGGTLGKNALTRHATNFVGCGFEAVDPLDEPRARAAELPARRPLRPRVQRVDHRERDDGIAPN